MLCCAFWGLLIALPVQAQQPAPDLKLVPPDALAFAHVRVAEIWKSDALKDYRKIIQKAGPQALAVIDADFVPAPSTIERITMVVLSLDKDKGEPKLVTILAFNTPFDAAKVKAQYMPLAKELQAGGKKYLFEPGEGLAIYFADKQTLTFSDGDTMAEYLAMPAKATGPLSEGLALAAKHPLVVSGNVKDLPLPPNFAENIPEEYHPLLKAQTLTFVADASKDFTLALKAKFPNAADAAAGEKSLRTAGETARRLLAQPKGEAEKMVFGKKKDGPRPIEELPQVVAGIAGLGGINTLDEILADLPLKLEGDTVSATVNLPAYLAPYGNLAIVGAGLMLPAVQKAKAAAARMSSMNNLKQIAIAMHSYEATNGHFPPAAICDKNGKPLLSWRVAILPYLEQQNLYDQFKLDEAWDSDNNRKLVARMPKLYMDPRVPLGPENLNKTYYKVFVGKDAGFQWDTGAKPAAIADGLSNTVMAAAAGDPAIWSKPEDFEFDPKQKLPELTKPFDVLMFAMFDGSVRTIRPKNSKNFETLMKALITPNGGETYTDFDDR